MSEKFKNKVVVITDGNIGIGDLVTINKKFLMKIEQCAAKASNIFF